MKPIRFKSVLSLSLALLLMTSATPMTNSSFAATSNYKVGDTFKDAAFKTVKNPTVTNIVQKDLTGDGKVDTLYVVGSKFEKTDNYFEQFYYVLKNGKTGKQVISKLPYEEGYSAWGYEPVVELVKLDNDTTYDVQFSSYSGGSGGFVYYNVATFKNGVFKTLLGQKELGGLTISGKYVDGFKADLYCKEIDKHWTQDLSFQKANLIEMKTYDANGKVLNPVEPWTGPLVNVKIQDGYVTAEQSLKGLANADYIGSMHVFYSFTNGKLKITGVSVEQVLKMD